MIVRTKRNTWFVAGMLWALVSGLPAAMADDTELFIGDTTQFPQNQPNILFILDTSGSMNTNVTTQTVWDPMVSFPGSCDPTRVYWRRGTGNPPGCGTNRWFNGTALACDAAAQAFNVAGLYTDRMAQYDPNADDRWERISSGRKDRIVECEDDSSIHGDGSDPDEVYAQNGNDNELWSDDSADEVAWGNSPTDRVYTLYSGNYLNWFHNAATVTRTRLEIMQEVSTQLLSTINGVNVGLMRFNDEEGGPVVHAMEDIATARGPITTKINAWTPGGWTPLSETLYEAGLYYMGGAVDYGLLTDPETSVVESKDPNQPANYLSPMEFGCQKNFAVMLTDGEPTRDVGANSKIESLPGFGTAVGPSCDLNGVAGQGHCLDDMAEYMFQSDLAPGLGGQQNVITYTIGFAVDLPILASTAARGGGVYFTANDTATLSTALTNIVTSILDTQTTFTAPAVSVNSFNRTRNLNDLFITVFQATGDVHWPGNLKKYTLSGESIVDADGNPAVDPATGFFADGARSHWSPQADGAEVVKGGAANQIPPSSSRKLYTFLGNAPGAIIAPGNNMAKSNAGITTAMLGLGNPGDPSRDNVLDFARGIDVTDEDQDGDTTEARNTMGDPLHSKPVSVIYGPTLQDATVYFATNDGYLHAIDPNTGAEKWAFIPPDFIGNMVDLYINDSSPNKLYGIDGNLRVQTFANNDGVIDQNAGEQVILFFGLRRGGQYYYALDVTNPDQPQLLWRLDGSTLPDVGQTWADPVPTRINVAGSSQDNDKLVVVLGGGYDPTQDNLQGSTDSSGNAIYIVDSRTGALLWSAGNNNAHDKVLADMDYSIPANIKVIDLNGDKFADRMYASDMGGQVWRFDIFNNQNASSLVNGGVIAQLGTAGSGSTAASLSRRMYYSPDAALVSDDDNNFINIGVGSGHRARPNSVFTEDRFYSLRDYEPFQAKSQAYYDGLTPPTDADLIDVTDDVAAVVPAGSPGWRLELREGGWIGEKVLAESRTFDSKIFFTTFTPGAGATAQNCEPALGTNKLYIVDILNGAPVNNLDGVGDETNLTLPDRYTTTKGSIASEVTFLFPSPDDPVNCVGDECTPPPVACVDLFCFRPGFANNPIRTFWSEETTQ